MGTLQGATTEPLGSITARAETPIDPASKSLFNDAEPKKRKKSKHFSKTVDKLRT